MSINTNNSSIDKIIYSNDIILKNNISKPNLSIQNITNSINNKKIDKYIVIDSENPILIEQNIQNNYYTTLLNKFTNIDNLPIFKCIQILFFFFTFTIFIIIYNNPKDIN